MQRKLCGARNDFGTGTIPLESFAKAPVMVPGGTGAIETGELSLKCLGSVGRYNCTDQQSIEDASRDCCHLIHDRPRIGSGLSGRRGFKSSGLRGRDEISSPTPERGVERGGLSGLSVVETLFRSLWAWQTASQPPVIGGKNAISLAPAIGASGRTWRLSIALRTTFGFSKA